MRDFMNPQRNDGGRIRLYPYAKDLYYHPSGVLSMTLQIYDDMKSQDFNFGIVANGNLKEFLDQLYEGEIYEEE